MSWRESLRPLAAPPFRSFLAGRTIDLLGNSMAPVAVAFAVLHIGGDAGDLGIVLAARSIPLIVFVLYGGVIADRFPRHRVLVVACALSGAVQVLAAALLIGDVATVATLAAVEAVHGSVSAFTMPAIHGIVPQLVDRRQLQQANALTSAGRSAALMIGPAVSGILVATVGAGWALAVDGGSYLVAGLLFARLRLAPVERASTSMVAELRDGWSEFVARTWVWVVVLGFGVLNAVYACGWVTLGPVVADGTIGADGWGFVLTVQAVGFLLGTVVMLRVSPRFPLRLGMIGALGLALPMAALGVSPEFVLLAVASFVAGIGLELFGVTWETSLQQHVPLDKLSRVASYDMLGSIIALPLGQLAAGPLVVWFDVRSVVVGCAVVYAAVALAVLLAPSVWRLGAAPGDSVEVRATP
ncbi:MAG: MFS transporter [Nocardioidaceae bacterium]